MSRRRGTQHRRRREGWGEHATSSGGHWAVIRCSCCSDDSVIWVEDGYYPGDDLGNRIEPIGVETLPDGRTAIRYPPLD